MTTENTTIVTDETEVKNPTGLLSKNKKLLANNAELTARVAELEGQLAQAQEGHTKEMETAQAEIAKLKDDFDNFHTRHALQKLANAISDIPDLWTAEFSKRFKLEPVEGDEFGVFTLDGKRLEHTYGKWAGQAVKAEAADLWTALNWPHADYSNDPENARIGKLSRYFGPSGYGTAGSSSVSGSRAVPPTPAVPRPPLGLR